MTTATVLAAALAFWPADAKLAYQTSEKLVERHTPRDAGTIPGRLAARFIFDAANASGLDATFDSFSAETESGPRLFANITCDYVSDPSAPWLVFVSHYDTKPGVACPGANDGASTSGLLVAIASRLFDDKPKGVNVRLVWTDGEECRKAYSKKDGFWGSRHAAKKLKGDKLDVRAVVCLDMLGDRDLNISIPRNGTDSLRGGVLEMAKRAGIAEKVSVSDDLVKDDHVAFLDEGFPAVDIIDFDYGSKRGLNDYWHTPADTMDKVSEESLLAVGRLAIAIINEIR